LVSVKDVLREYAAYLPLTIRQIFIGWWEPSPTLRTRKPSEPLHLPWACSMPSLISIGFTGTERDYDSVTVSRVPMSIREAFSARAANEV
jgi:hypothetical protein